LFLQILKSYKTDEKKLKKEFEIFGPIKRIRVVEDKKTGKPRGYAFIEFEKERDFESKSTLFLTGLLVAL